MFIEMNLIPFLLMINIFSCLKNRSICPGTGFRNSIRIIKMGMIMWPGTESSIQAAFFFFRVEGAAKALADIFIIFFSLYPNIYIIIFFALFQVFAQYFLLFPLFYILASHFLCIIYIILFFFRAFCAFYFYVVLFAIRAFCVILYLKHINTI